MRTSSSQAEGAEREFQVVTLSVEGKNGRVTGVKCARADDRRQPIPGSEFIIKADLVFIAIGFAGSVKTGLLEQAAVDMDRRGNVLANDRDYRTSSDKVFVAGDMRRGPVAHRLGDPRGPSGCARHRRAPHGRKPAAGLAPVAGRHRGDRRDGAGPYVRGQRKSSARPGRGAGATPSRRAF
jgi:NADPH-dependent glutamate synthase beta subunit-like oxidoreductase